MTQGMYRIGIVGASSLAGKELSDALAESALGASDFVLLDEDDAAGTMTATGDEPAFIQRLDAESFAGMDFVFFTGSAGVTQRHWQSARRAGVSIIDMTYALEREPGVLVRAPWVMEALGAGGVGPNLETPAVVAAHPVAVMAGLVAARVAAKMDLRNVAATVLEPASEYGRAAMDELHQQTVNLLSFQNIPREEYDAQVAFNLLPALGTNAKVKLEQTERRIREEYAGLTIGTLPKLAVQMVQAPVFHGYVVSMLVEVTTETTVEAMEIALAGEGVDLVADESDPPSNLSATGQDNVMVKVRGEAEAGSAGTRFWVWMAADNLKLAARNAIACAQELRRLRPLGKVQ